MRNRSEHILDRVNALVDENFGHFLVIVSMAATTSSLLYSCSALGCVLLVETRFCITVFVAVRDHRLMLQIEQK